MGNFDWRENALKVKSLSERYINDFARTSERQKQYLNPFKMSVPLLCTGDGQEISYENIMCGRGDEGILSKTIRVDNSHSTLNFELINYISYDKDFALGYCNVGLTHIRCAVMASVIISLMKLNKSYDKIVVGVCGLGRITASIVKMLNDIYGISNFVVYSNDSFNGTSDFPSLKRYEAVSGQVSYNDCECDVLFCATTNTNRLLRLPNKLTSLARHIVTFDGNQSVSETEWRGRTLYSDYPRQLESIFEYEFPLVDKSYADKFIQLGKWKLGDNPTYTNITGLGFMDAIVFEAFKEYFDKERKS